MRSGGTPGVDPLFEAVGPPEGAPWARPLDALSARRISPPPDGWWHASRFAT
jgi:hypothetical protein